MKKIFVFLCVLVLSFSFFACKNQRSNNSSNQTSGFSSENSSSEAASSKPEPEKPSSVASETSDGNVSSGQTSSEESTYGTKEISRNGKYKTMEMRVYDDNREISRRITFEIPVEWEGESSVFALKTEQDLHNMKSDMKVDMWDVLSVTREDVLREHYLGDEAFEDYEGEDRAEVIYKDIYSTENYEVFFNKILVRDEGLVNVYVYWLYSNGERFSLAGYVFVENTPEHDAIFKRIAESVKFQF